MYVQTVRRSIYKTKQPEHPRSPNPRHKQRPQGIPFVAPLHVILPVHSPTLRCVYVYVYSYFYAPVHLRRRHDHRKHCTAESRSCTPSYQLSDVIPVIGISSFSDHSFWLDLTNGFDLIRLNWGFVWLDSIVVFIWLDSLVFVDLIWLTSNISIFEPSHTIWITLQSGFRKSHIGQDVFEIFHHWNRVIIHNSDNWNWVWWKHSKREQK